MTMGKYVNLAGREFGSLIVVRRAPKEKGSRKTLWLCRCACGQEVVRDGYKLVAGISKTCGQESHKISSPRPPSLTAEHKLTYVSWRKMRERCYNLNSHKYPNYGARGIEVCSAWRDDFVQFFADMGPRPSKDHSIDRIDANGHYEPGNCRWATRQEQAENKTCTVFVETPEGRVKLIDYAKRFPIPANIIYARLIIGWDLERAVSTPVRKTKRSKQ